MHSQPNLEIACPLRAQPAASSVGSPHSRDATLQVKFLLPVGPVLKCSVYVFLCMYVNRNGKACPGFLLIWLDFCPLYICLKPNM